MRAAVELRVVFADLPDISRDELEEEVAVVVRESLAERLGPVEHPNVMRVEMYGG